MKRIIPITEVEESSRPVGCVPCFFGSDRDVKAVAAVVDDEKGTATGICANHAEVGEEQVQQELRRRWIS